MFGLLKLFFYAFLLIAFVWFGRSVPIGEHSLFAHVQRIWQTEEAQDLVEGAKTSAGPTIDKIKRGVEAGVEAAEKAESDAGVGKITMGRAEVQPGRRADAGVARE